MDDFESPIWGTKRDFWSTFCQFYKLACVINTKPISAPFPSFSFLYYYTTLFTTNKSKNLGESSPFLTQKITPDCSRVILNLGWKDSNLRNAWTKTRCLTTWRHPIGYTSILPVQFDLSIFLRNFFFFFYF